MENNDGINYNGFIETVLEETIMTPSYFERRRQFLQGVALGAAMFTVPGVFAEELARTPRQTEGPFYHQFRPPDGYPLK